LTPVASVPLTVFDPATVISRRWYGGEIANPDPPPVPGVRLPPVAVALNTAWKIAATLAESVMP
jgi:hypothetical protein